MKFLFKGMQMYVRSIYFSAEGPKGILKKILTYTNRSFAFVEKFKDFPTDQFTIEMWIKNKRTGSEYTICMLLNGVESGI